MYLKFSFFLALLFFSHIFLAAEPNRNIEQMLQRPHKPDSLLLRFQPGTTQAQKELFFLKLQATKIHEYKLVPGLYAITMPTNSDLNATFTWLLDSPEVMYVEPNKIIKKFQHPNDPSYDELYAMPTIKAQQSWHIRTESTVLLASIDDGIDYTHPDLASNIWTNPGEIPGNHIDDDGNGYIDDVHGYDFYYHDGDPMPTGDGHGTHTVGTMIARGNNGQGVVGVCWSGKIVAARIFSPDETTLEAILEAIEYCIQQKAKVANMSYGGPDFDQSEYDMMSAARDHGMICVCAAGNASNNNDDSPSYPANYELDNIISVAATDANDQMASFSNYGFATVDLAAPGVDIYSTFPDSCAPWKNQSRSFYVFGSGTSMAAPHVSGACALLWSEHPHLNYKQVIDRICRNVDVIPELPVRTGGRLNLYNAMMDRAAKKEGPNETGCNAYVDSNSFGLGNLLPYLAILFFVVWRWRKVRPAFSLHSNR